jgi:AcrR family transcriptional regulator
MAGSSYSRGRRRVVGHKLKPGPGKSPGQVAAHQLSRLHTATIELVADRGYAAVTVEALVESAQVSKASFYKHFSDKQACFLSTYDSVVRCSARQVHAALQAELDREMALRRSLLTIAAGLAERPKATQLALVDAFDAGSAVIKRMQRTSKVFETLVCEVFAKPPSGVRLDAAIARGIVGGINRVARRRVMEGRARDFVDDVEPLLEWALSLCDKSPSSSGAFIWEGQVAERRDPMAQAEPCDDRALLHSAIARVVTRDGYEGLTVADVREAAGVSKRRFDAHFDALPDCFISALNDQASKSLSQADAAFRSADSWQQGVNRATAALCSCMAEDPSGTWMTSVALLELGSPALEWLASHIATVAGYLRASAPDDLRPTELAAEASVAGAWAVLRHQVRAGQAQRLPDVAPTVARLAAGPAAAGSRM